MPARSLAPARLAHRLLTVALPCLLALGCSRAPAPLPAERPAEAVHLLVERLRADDAVGFVDVAVPPALHERLEAGWRAGTTRWPLDELPLDGQLAPMLGALAADGAPTRLQGDFDRQFARADRELKAAAVSLGVFGTRYVQGEGDYSAEERDHYAQGIRALSAWGARAPLSDPQRAKRGIAELTTAARRAGIASDADFSRLGMDESLRRLGPFLRAGKRSIARYGLDLDATLAGLDARLLDQAGDAARIRVRYTLAGGTVDTIVGVVRVDGRWYVRDYLRRAEASLAPPAGGAAATRAAR
jgi:hypothetical protein